MSKSNDDDEKCRFGKYCDRHNFVHGAEAKELREKLQDILADLDNAVDEDSVSSLQSFPDEMLSRLEEMLEDVDARDSLAFDEALEDEADDA